MRRHDKEKQFCFSDLAVTMMVQQSQWKRPDHFNFPFCSLFIKINLFSVRNFSFAMAFLKFFKNYENNVCIGKM